MIFVTVGTHEQQFNRLVEYMDEWAKKNGEEVIIQIGFSTYEPQFAHYKKLYSFEEMNSLLKEARIVITHGGPSSFVSALKIGKIPIVVPRQKKYDEHINDHQIKFCREVKKRYGNILVVEEIEEIEMILEQYDEIVGNIKKSELSNNTIFCKKFDEIVEGMF